MEEKYKLKQEMLVMKQDRSSYMMYGSGKGSNSDSIGINNSSSNNYTNNNTDHTSNQ